MATDDPLWSALQSAHSGWSTEAAERFPLAPQWEPLQGEPGTVKILPEQRLKVSVPAVPTVPAENEDSRHQIGGDIFTDARMEWGERAAIMEFDGGRYRSDAEHLAAVALAFRQPK